MRANAEFSIRFPGGFHRCQIGADVILPQAESRENVRGHMDGMRRGGRDARIAASSLEPELRVLRTVSAMNQVVGHTGMIRKAVEQRRKNVDSGFLILQTFVEVCSRKQRKRIEDGGFMVIRIAPVDFLHRGGIGCDALVVRSHGVVLIENR